MKKKTKIIVEDTTNKNRGKKKVTIPREEQEEAHIASIDDTSKTVTKFEDVVNIPVKDIDPNDYNPNYMDEEEFEKYKAEVRRMGKVPKPIIVKKNAGRYSIIDGEHAHKAAKELGYETIPCQVCKVGGFEAMRQTFIRTKRGKNNAAKVGLMILRMRKKKGISNRDMATELGISEGTVRNYLLYPVALKLRNDYAPGEGNVSTIANLTSDQVRHYVRVLGKDERDKWLDDGALVPVKKNEYDGGHSADPESSPQIAGGNSPFAPNNKNEASLENDSSEMHEVSGLQISKEEPQVEDGPGESVPAEDAGNDSQQNFVVSNEPEADREHAGLKSSNDKQTFQDFLDKLSPNEKVEFDKYYAERNNLFSASGLRNIYEGLTEVKQRKLIINAIRSALEKTRIKIFSELAKEDDIRNVMKKVVEGRKNANK